MGEVCAESTFLNMGQSVSERKAKNLSCLTVYTQYITPTHPLPNEDQYNLNICVFTLRYFKA